MHTRTLRGEAGFLLAVVLLAVACGDDDNSRPDGGDRDSGDRDATTHDAGHDSGAPSDGDAFLTQYAAAVCAIYESCCNARELGYDAAGCTEWFRDVTAAYFGAGTGEYRSEAGARCLSELAAASAADEQRCRNVVDFDQATLRETCELAFVRPLNDGAPLGGDCLLARDCAGTTEPGTVICYGGSCLVEQRGEAGDGPCFFGSGDGIEGTPTHLAKCDARDELYCDRSVNQCAPKVADGEQCPRGDACRSTALCSGGICQTLPGVDETCLNAIPNVGGYCRAGTACDVASLTCSAALEEGAPCREDRECASASCDVTCSPPPFTRAINCTGE